MYTVTVFTHKSTVREVDNKVNHVYGSKVSRLGLKDLIIDHFM